MALQRRGDPPSQIPKRIFWLGLMSAFALGLTVREVFHPRRLDRWATRALAQAQRDVEIRYDKVRLNLSHGYLPALELRVENLAVVSKSPCAFVREVRAQDLYLPLSFSDLIRLRLRVGVARLDEGRVVLAAEAPSCGGATISDWMQGRPWEDLEKPLARLRENWPVEAIRLQRVVWQWSTGERPFEFLMQHFVVRNLGGGGGISWDGMAHVPAWLGLRDLPRVHVEGSWGEEGVRTAWMGHWKEGRLSLTATLARGGAREGERGEESPQLSTEMSFEHVPVVAINQIADRLLGRDASVSSQRPLVWISCVGRGEGPVNKPGKLTLNFQPCQMRGDLGEVEVRGLQFADLLNPRWVGAVEVAFANLPVPALQDVIGLNVQELGLAPGSAPRAEGMLTFSANSRRAWRGRWNILDLQWQGWLDQQVQQVQYPSLSMEMEASPKGWDLKVGKVGEGPFDVTVKRAGRGSVVAVRNGETWVFAGLRDGHPWWVKSHRRDHAERARASESSRDPASGKNRWVLVDLLLNEYL